MVFKRYIKKRGQTFGPYYYESYRDKDGIVRKRYLGTELPKKFKKNSNFIFYLIPIILAILLISFFLIERNIIGRAVEEEASSVPVDNEAGQEQVPEPEPESVAEQVSATTETPTVDITTEIPEIPAETTEEPIQETPAETPTETTEEEETNETIEEIEEETNETVEQPTSNETITEVVNETEIIANQTTTNQTVTNEGILNETAFNESLTNVTVANETIESNLTTNISIKTIQYKAVIGKPVKWKKIVSNVSEAITVEIPKTSENITLNKIKDDEVVENTSENNLSENNVFGSNLITGQAISEKGENFKIKKENLLVLFFKKLFRFTGFSVFEENPIEVSITPEENATNEKYEIEYYTDAPQAVEENTSSGKIITITGPDDVHYEDILAYTELNNTPEENIKLYHVVNGSKVKSDFISYDEDGISGIEYIEWVVPSLSEQVYSLEIVITDSMHLDENRSFVANIYTEVNQTDGIVYTIPENQYARVKFRQSLTNQNDITIYAKSNGTSNIEVYLKDSDEKIAEINGITTENYYKTYLTNLTGTNDTFDLKIIGDYVEFDYIVDPTTYAYNYSSGNLKAYEMGGAIPTHPYNTSLTEASAGNYTNINASDDLRWITGAAVNNGEYDSQVFIFNLTGNVSDSSLVSKLNFTWEGYGETQQGYYTNISIWDWNSRNWSQISNLSFGTAADQSVSVSLSTSPTNYVNSTSKEVAVLVTTRKYSEPFLP